MRKVPFTVHVGADVVPPLVKPVTLAVRGPATEKVALAGVEYVSSNTAHDGMVAVITASETLPPLLVTVYVIRARPLFCVSTATVAPVKAGPVISCAVPVLLVGVDKVLVGVQPQLMRAVLLAAGAAGKQTVPTVSRR